MRRKKIITIMKEDLKYFPPSLSLIRVLSELNYDVVHIGSYSDVYQKRKIEEKGVRFINTPVYHTEGHALQKFIDIHKFKKAVLKALEIEQISDGDYIWIINPANMIPLNSIIGRYSTILQFYEFAKPSVTLSYKIYNPFFNLKKTCEKADKIIHCEINRALFFKEIYQLKRVPYVIPNKPVIDESLLTNPPEDILQKVNHILNKVKGRKVILYQGIFSPKERRLDEFCEAVHKLPEEYVFVAMGRGGDYFKQLSFKYSDDDRVILVDFITPPYHLLITKIARLGVLTYFPPSNDIADIINIFYCAPNKIFEYGKFGIPMISNRLPGLEVTFRKYNNGVCIEDIASPKSICEAVLTMEKEYDKYSQGARNYFNSIDISTIVSSILKDE